MTAIADCITAIDIGENCETSRQAIAKYTIDGPRGVSFKQW